MLRLSKFASSLLLLFLLVAGVSSARAQGSYAVTAGAIDLGSLPDAAPVRRMQLVLARSPQQEERLEALLAAQQKPGTPEFQKWLTPVQFGQQFGPAQDATDRLIAWLAAQGFKDIKLSSGRTLLEFSGPAGALRAAFGADVHHYTNASGQNFYMLKGSATVPAEFAPLVKGLASLGVAPVAAPNGKELRRDNLTGAVSLRTAPGAHANFTLNSNATTYYAVTPYDFATIYNVLPLWNAASPIDGTGQTIAVAGDTDINPADFVAFRNLFGLPVGNTATPTGTQYLNIIYNGPKPAFQTDEFHADSDTQWAGAAAKGATIDYVASRSTEASSGLDLSAAYIVDNNLASVLVASYSSCELSLGTAGNGFYKAIWQQAAAQGIAVVTATGDSGAAACDGAHVGPAMRGTAVNGMARPRMTYLSARPSSTRRMGPHPTFRRRTAATFPLPPATSRSRSGTIPIPTRSSSLPPPMLGLPPSSPAIRRRPRLPGWSRLQVEAVVLPPASLPMPRTLPPARVAMPSQAGRQVRAFRPMACATRQMWRCSGPRAVRITSTWSASRAGMRTGRSAT